MYKFLTLGFLKDPCHGCNGEGHYSDWPGGTPLTCEVCNGEGTKVNPLVMLSWIVLMILLTGAPFLYGLW